MIDDNEYKTISDRILDDRIGILYTEDSTSLVGHKHSIHWVPNKRHDMAHNSTDSGSAGKIVTMYNRVY